MKRNMKLRDYQITPVNEISENKKGIDVLAAAPVAGKTEMSIATLMLYLTQSPESRVLILTHGTNILLDNFLSRLDDIQIDFTYSDILSDDSQIHLCLPHNEHKIKGRYDFLIVDEAHEHYSAPRVQRIIEKTKPKKQLLLTATPSKFVGIKGFNILTIAANELPPQYLAKLNIELVESSYDWMGNYNRTDNLGEVKVNHVSTIDDTMQSLENVMLKLMGRLNYKYSAEEFNNPGLITKVKTFFNKKVLNWNKASWGEIFTEIGKTMIVCKTIEDARLVKSVLDNNEVQSLLSDSETDPDSENMLKFKRNECDLIVVVKRGILGYSDDDLMNIIDMSGTHNPNVIYQMFGRLFRGGDKMKKYYVKLTPKNELDKGITELATCAALMLTDRRYLSTYNGKNFKNFKIPVKVKEIIKEKKERTEERKTTASTYLPDITTYDVIRFFKDVIHDSNNDASVYKEVTIREALGALGYVKPTLPPLTKVEVFASAGIIIEG